MAKIKKIDRRLNIVVDVETDDGKTFHVHAAPIGREVWEANFNLLGRTISDLYGEGYTVAMSSHFGHLQMKKVAKELGAEDELSALTTEIYRNVNVLHPSNERGWETIPYEEALKTELIDEEDAAALSNLLHFFTAASWVQTPGELHRMVYPTFKRSGLHVTSLNSTDWKPSSETSTPAENSGEKAPALSIPV